MSIELDVSKQIMWNRLISVVEEQAITLIKTAFCTSVREAGDLSAGVYDRQGRLIAQAVTGTPGHVNTMAESVFHFIDHFGYDDMKPGDVFVTNDPWKATGHLHDITVITPVFNRDQLVGFFGSTAHVVDIGGRGFGPDGRSVYEEGLLIPLTKLFYEGVVNKDLINILANNVREKDQVVGDFYSLAACNDTGRKRLLEMMAEFGLNDIEGVAEFIFQHSEAATIEKIDQLPKGVYDYSMATDGYDEPLNLNVALTIGNGEILMNFAGSSPQSSFGINVPLVYSKAYGCYGLKCAIAPQVPNNWASLKPFKAEAPDNCILNAKRPAPVAVRHAIGHLVPDLVLGALKKAVPDVAPAEGASALWNLHVSLRKQGEHEAQTSEVLLFNSGGTGARAGLDGLSATAFPSGVHTMPVEVTESVGPIIIWRKELRPDSGGAGKHRGGLGQVIEFGAQEGYAFSFNAMFERVKHPAMGHAGGLPGACGNVYLKTGAPLKSKGLQFVEPGESVVLELPGGGGYGVATERSKEAVRSDIEDGYITQQSADELYLKPA